MRNLSPKIKLLIAGAVALIALFLIIAIVQIAAVHRRDNKNKQLNEQLDNYIDKIAGSNPPSIKNFKIEKQNYVAELEL